MNSLVCYGLSSDSDSDSDVKRCCQGAENAGGKTEPATQATKGRNFLLESGSVSSDSEGDYSNEEEEQSSDARTESPVPIQQHIPQEPLSPASSTLKANKLPPPPLGASGGLVGSSVFANPFKEQADERLNVLQKHVPLTLQARPTQIGGKKICIGYRKDGRCRFGSRCKFAHDSDLQNTDTLVTLAAADEELETCSDQTSSTQTASQSHDCQTSLLQKQGREEDGAEERRMKKKRVGLSETLIPPKRALKQYDRQKDRANPL